MIPLEALYQERAELLNENFENLHINSQKLEQINSEIKKLENLKKD